MRSYIDIYQKPYKNKVVISAAAAVCRDQCNIELGTAGPTAAPAYLRAPPPPHTYRYTPPPPDTRSKFKKIGAFKSKGCNWFHDSYIQFQQNKSSYSYI